MGDVVLIKYEKLPPLKWMMGRIIKTHPGPENHVRVCTIEKINGTLTHPIGKLAPTPISEHQHLNQMFQSTNENQPGTGVEGN